MIHTDATIEAIITDIRTRMPTLDEMEKLPEDAGMGPDVTIPAVWMHLLLSHMRLLDVRIVKLGQEAVGALPRHDPPMTDVIASDYAAALAKHAVYACGGEGTAAASVLIHSAVTVMVTTMPPEAVIKALDNVVDIFDLRATLGMEATIQ